MAGLLLLLPAELRLHIYNYILLASDSKILVNRTYNLSAQFLRTSRSINSECLPYLYGSNTFSELTAQHPANPHPQPIFLQFLAQIGPTAASCIKTVELQEQWDQTPWHGPDFRPGFEALTGLAKIKIHVFYNSPQAFPDETFNALQKAETLARRTLFTGRDEDDQNPKLFATLIARISQPCQWDIVFEVGGDKCTQQFRSRIRFVSVGGVAILGHGEDSASAVVESKTRERKFQFGMVPHTRLEDSKWTAIKLIKLKGLQHTPKG